LKKVINLVQEEETLQKDFPETRKIKEIARRIPMIKFTSKHLHKNEHFTLEQLNWPSKVIFFNKPQ